MSKPAMTTPDVPQELLQFRERIDSIDEEILAALARRFAVTERVGRLKAQHGLDSVDPVREQEKLQRLSASAEQKGLDGKLVHELFQRIFNEVVKNHRQLLAAAQQGAK
ncbi:MAG TPA: chorismate mutase [Pseudomonadales bacterium]